LSAGGSPQTHRAQSLPRIAKTPQRSPTTAHPHPRENEEMTASQREKNKEDQRTKIKVESERKKKERKPALRALKYKEIGGVGV